MSANVYVIMSSAKAHCYPNWATWALVSARAERMGVKGLEAFRPQMSAFKTRKTSREVERAAMDAACHSFDCCRGAA